VPNSIGTGLDIDVSKGDADRFEWISFYEISRFFDNSEQFFPGGGEAALPSVSPPPQADFYLFDLTAAR